MSTTLHIGWWRKQMHRANRRELELNDLGNPVEERLLDALEPDPLDGKRRIFTKSAGSPVSPTPI